MYIIENRRKINIIRAVITPTPETPQLKDITLQPSHCLQLNSTSKSQFHMQSSERTK